MKSEISPAVSNNTLGIILFRRGGRYCIIIKVRLGERACELPAALWPELGKHFVPREEDL